MAVEARIVASNAQGKQWGQGGLYELFERIAKRAPGIRYEDLPPIDVVLVSHNHYDHMDVPTLRRLAADHKPRIFAGLGSRAIMFGEGVGGASDLDWWQVEDVAPEVRVTGVPATHFSNRGLCDRNNTLWMGFVVSGPAGIVLRRSSGGRSRRRGAGASGCSASARGATCRALVIE